MFCIMLWKKKLQEQESTLQPGKERSLRNIRPLSRAFLNTSSSIVKLELKSVRTAKRRLQLLWDPKYE